MSLATTPHDALLVIDMQNDFVLPGAPLAVAGATEIIAGINTLAARFDHVLCTQDWHPAGHISFASSHPGKRPYTDTVEAAYGTQTLWPDHCLQGTPGAALHSGLDLPHAELILRKGFRRGIDSYSAFLENDRATPTGLAAYLHERGLTRLFFVGVAYDFCVGFSAIAAAGRGFQSFVIEELTRAVDLPGTVESTRREFASRGVQTIESVELS